jgi:hypothetical protein
MSDVHSPVRITHPETPRQLRAALSKRGITQQGFARLTGRNPRTVRRWCDERRPEPFDVFTRTFITVALDRFDASDCSASPPHLPAPIPSLTP